MTTNHKKGAEKKRILKSFLILTFGVGDRNVCEKKRVFLLRDPKIIRRMSYWTSMYSGGEQE
jgi:hypothetical protein